MHHPRSSSGTKLTAEGKQIKKRKEIIQLLQAVWEPEQVAGRLCSGHQKKRDIISTGSEKADREDKKAAKTDFLTAAVTLHRQRS